MCNLAVGLIVSFFLLFLRKKKWLTGKLRWIIVVALAVVGLAGLLLTINGKKGTLTPSYQSLFIPLLHNCIDRLYKYWNMKIHGRDFYLYIRGSGEEDHPGMSGSDIFFSLSLLFITLGLVIVSIAVFRVYQIIPPV